MRVTLIPIDDASGYRGEAEAVLTPDTAEEIAEILAKASREGIGVTVSGGGTGVTGGRVPHGGWVVSLDKFRKLEIRKGSAVVGAGVLLKDLHAAAARSGQLYAPDPTEWTASVGGTIATNASGSRSFLYGATRKHVLSLTCAFADGTVRTFQRGDAIDFAVPSLPLPATTKNTAGYPLQPGMDWIDLICGSEGTLCVVCEAEMRLLPGTGELITGVVFFPGDAAAVSAVDDWRGVEHLRMLEYFDAGSLDLLRPRFEDIPRNARAAVLIEQEGDDIDPWIDRIGELDSWFAATDQDRERIRKFRHALPEIVNDTVRRNGLTKLGSDYAVPLERNLEMLAAYHERLQGEFRYVIFGHIGDAHVHVNILPATPEEFERGKTAMVDLAKKAVAFGGTVSAEHGLGKRKAHLLELQFTPEHLDAMKRVKLHLDPAWILGRGNLFAVPE